VLNRFAGAAHGIGESVARHQAEPMAASLTTSEAVVAR
jgi:hypothetical protein